MARLSPMFSDSARARERQVAPDTFPGATLRAADAFLPNNWAAGVEMIPSNGPDLEILSVAVGGGQVSAMICNRGAVASGPYTPSQPWVRTGVVVAADSNPLNDALLAPAP